MGKEKESKPKTNEQQEDPVLIALKKCRWNQTLSGIWYPEGFDGKS